MFFKRRRDSTISTPPPRWKPGPASAGRKTRAGIARGSGFIDIAEALLGQVIFSAQGRHSCTSGMIPAAPGVPGLQCITLREKPGLMNMAAQWFHSKWGVPKEAYLVTDHTGFYERYGWKFLCMVQGDGEPDMTRMYIRR